MIKHLCSVQESEREREGGREGREGGRGGEGERERSDQYTYPRTVMIKLFCKAKNEVVKVPTRTIQSHPHTLDQDQAEKSPPA